MATRPNKAAALSAETTVEQLAIKAAADQETARLAQLKIANNVIAEIVGGLKTAAQTISDLETQVAQEKDKLRGTDDAAGKYEAAYLAIGAAAHRGKWSADTCKAALQTALTQHYANRADETIGPVAKLRTLLSRAMNENVRGDLPKVIKPWIDAWIAEAGQDKTPLRDKFHSRQVLVEQAIKLAIGNPGRTNPKTGKVTGYEAPLICRDTERVEKWVVDNPRKGRDTKTSSNATPAAALVVAPADKKSRPVAEARITALINAVNDVARDYPAATTLFAQVMADLRKCTSDLLLPTAAPKAAPAEPIAGAADLDDAMGADETPDATPAADDEMALLEQEMALVRRKRALLAGK